MATNTTPHPPLPLVASRTLRASASAASLLTLSIFTFSLTGCGVKRIPLTLIEPTYAHVHDPIAQATPDTDLAKQDTHSQTDTPFTRSAMVDIPF